MLDWFTNENWLAWGIGLIIGFPLLTILFGELLHRIERSKPREESHAYMGKLQYFVLPSLVINLLLVKVLELEHELVIVRIAATFFWVSMLYFFMSLFNLYWFRDDLDDDDFRSRIPSLVLNIARMFFAMLGIAVILSLVWTIDLGQMLAALGVGSIVLGLALQDTLGGLFAGITLISTRQFTIGDWLKTGDEIGEVITVNWYSSSLLTLEGDLLVIPNSVLASGTFYNFSQPTAIHMERIVIKFWEEEPPNTVKKALLEAAHATPDILSDPAPRICIIEFDDDAGAYEAQIFFDDYGKIDLIRDNFLSHVWYAAKRYNLVFPYEDQQLYHFDGNELNFGSDKTIKFDELVESLEQLNAFNLTQDELRTITSDATLLRFGQGEQIMKVGEDNSNIYVILSGETKEFVPDQQGKPRTMRNTLPGDIFGQRSALHRSIILVDVFAHTDTQIAQLPVESIEKVLKSNPRFAQEMEKEIESKAANIETLQQRGTKMVVEDEITNNPHKASNLKDLLYRQKQK